MLGKEINLNYQNLDKTIQLFTKHVKAYNEKILLY